MSVEPKEISKRGLDHLAAQADSTPGWHHGVKDLLAHIEHQEQTIVSLRAELATAREIAHSNLCCTAKIQAELDAERARAAELTALLRTKPNRQEYRGRLREQYQEWCLRVDQALASAGAEKSQAVIRECVCCDGGHHKQPTLAPVANPSPGASERRTFAVGDTVMLHPDPANDDDCGVIVSGPTPSTHGFPDHWMVKWNDGSRPGLFATDALCLIRRVTEIRDVIAAGDDNG
jgi:hypothetical protein